VWIPGPSSPPNKLDLAPELRAQVAAILVKIYASLGHLNLTFPLHVTSSEPKGEISEAGTKSGRVSVIKLFGKLIQSAAEGER
jgi:hypothetical protein